MYAGIPPYHCVQTPNTGIYNANYSDAYFEGPPSYNERVYAFLNIASSPLVW